MRTATRTATPTSITIGGIIIDFIMEAADSNGVASVFECTVAAGDHVPPPHSHDAFDETIYGLQGVFKFVVDGNTRCSSRNVRPFSNCGSAFGRRSMRVPVASSTPPNR